MTWHLLQPSLCAGEQVAQLCWSHLQGVHPPRQWGRAGSTVKGRGSRRREAEEERERAELRSDDEDFDELRDTRSARERAAEIEGLVALEEDRCCRRTIGRLAIAIGGLP